MQKGNILRLLLLFSREIFQQNSKSQQKVSGKYHQDCLCFTAHQLAAANTI
jgi:hypothetical protein